MIQFNLLPDVKIEYIKAKRLKRLVLAVTVFVVAGSVGLLGVMFSLVSYQKVHLSSLNSDIRKEQSAIQAVPDLNKVLTIQNQLKSMPDLYAQRPVTSRLFSYMEQTTPSAASITHMIVNFDDKTMKIEGKSVKLEAVNQYADTLKFTTFTVEGEEGGEAKKAFPDVVLSNFARDNKEATYNMSVTFDPAIFDYSKKITLTVPNAVTTRSETERPSALFDGDATQR